MTATLDAKTARKGRLRNRMRTLLRIAYATPVDPGWWKRARCRGQDPLFDAADTTTVDRLTESFGSANRERHRLAVEFCDACPVRAECLATAMRRGCVGTWGGELLTTEDWAAALGLKKELGL